MSIRFPQRFCREHRVLGECVCELMDSIGRPDNHNHWQFLYTLKWFRREKVLNETDSNGITPLFQATAYDNRKAVVALVHAKGDVNQGTLQPLDHMPVGTSPLWITLQITHNIAIACFLIQSGAKTEFNDLLDAHGKQYLEAAKKAVQKEQDAVALVLFSGSKYLPWPIVDICVQYLGPLDGTPPSAPKSQHK